MLYLLDLLKRIGFVAINFWLAFHVYCVASSPLTMEPHSELLSTVAQPALPYNQALFLNHGYHYFAPDVGSSTIVEYRIPKDNDVEIMDRFPHPNIGPRLMYHRYFMLADNFRAFPDEFQMDMLTAYARHFARKHNSDRIQLTITEHEPARAARIVAGGKLSDAESFRMAGRGTWNFPADSDPTWTMEVFNGDSVLRFGSDSPLMTSDGPDELAIPPASVTLEPQLVEPQLEESESEVAPMAPSPPAAVAPPAAVTPSVDKPSQEEKPPTGDSTNADPNLPAEMSDQPLIPEKASL